MASTVHIDLWNDDEIYIAAGYGDLELIKRVPGHKWNKVEKVWSYPRTMTTCRVARNVFGDRLAIGKQLNSWAREQNVAESAARSAAAAPDGELRVVPLLAPRMAQAMAARPYQRAGAAFIRQQGSCLVADEVGLGKSLMALAGIMERGLWAGQHLIIAPKTALESVWANEIRKWTDDAAVFAMPDGKAARAQVLEDYLADNTPTKFLVVNKEMARVKLDEWCAKCADWKELITEPDHYFDGHKCKQAVREMPWPQMFDIAWSSIINDEAHKTLSTGLKSTQSKTQMAEGITRLRTVSGGLKLAVTGTPVRGKEVNFWGPLFWVTSEWKGQQLRSEKIGGKWPWMESFLQLKSNGYGTEIGGVLPERSAAFNAMLDPLVLRRTRREVRSELPARVPQDVWVRMDDKHTKQYEKFREEGLTKVENGTIESVGILAEITRLKQLAWGNWRLGSEGELIATEDSPKLRRLADMLEARGLAGQPDDRRVGDAHKFIVASQFTQIVDVVQRFFEARGVTTLKITGAVTGKNRTEAVRAFQDDEDGPRLLVLNTMAGGESITLDRYCDEMFIMDETYIADDQEQLEGRIDNRSVRGDGDQRPRIYHYLRTLGTIEETIAANNIDQREMQANLLDRRRGVEVASRLLRGES